MCQSLPSREDYTSITSAGSPQDGALGVTVGYPLDTVKVRIQTQKKFTGVWHCFRSTFKTEGVRPIALHVVPKTVALEKGSTDTVKVRLQCQMEPRHFATNQTLPKYQGPIHCMLTIGREEGVLSLYRGAPALALRDGPSFATYFLTYNTLCEWLTPAGQKQPAWPVVMLAGGFAGVCGWTVGTPMDVIKARLQVDGIGKRRYNSFLHCIAESVRQEGPGVFFKGLGLNCMRAFPVNMVVFFTYEQVVRLLRMPS
ncbi:hypothetical protein SKAU_G00428740 [Synaphobranchus kaupii]|uniref:Solute carrier family 25 member 47 n=1 Tax=Synaphobranchus kaupii TaxID=118154 RepID=A0A9Q1IA19_SYNKA|nr:hypothetical protein SKAU_G00428740 [Synaphobranchus kaupii]